MNLSIGRNIPLDEEAFRLRRWHMVEEQIVRRNVRDKRVLEAMRSVPRHQFVAEEYRPFAYEDNPQPTLSGQTISQPYIVASMTELLQVRESSRVLEIGTGCGYQAAVLSRIASQVFSVELLPELHHLALTTLVRLGYDNIRLRLGDGSLGWPEEAPFDGIIVTAAAPEIPTPLLDQLAQGGRLVIPLKREDSEDQVLTLVQKESLSLVSRELYPVRFVPLCRGGREPR